MAEELSYRESRLASLLVVVALVLMGPAMISRRWVIEIPQTDYGDASEFGLHHTTECDDCSSKTYVDVFKGWWWKGVLTTVVGVAALILLVASRLSGSRALAGWGAVVCILAAIAATIFMSGAPTRFAHASDWAFPAFLVGALAGTIGAALLWTTTPRPSAWSGDDPA